MKKTILTSLACLVLGTATAFSQTTIAYWNFNDFSIATAGPVGSLGVPDTIAASQGAGTISLLNWTGNVASFSGATLNALNSDISGNSLALANVSGNSSFIQISFSMSGLTDLDISFATRGTSTGFDVGNWSYSTDGSAFTPFGENTGRRATSFAVASLGTNGLDNAPTAFLRYTLSGATTTTGNNRIDNLQLNAVPEPSVVILFGIGLAFVLWRMRATRRQTV